MSIRAAVTEVLARVARAERDAARAPGSVRLVGASKTRTIAEVQDALQCGVAHFGENYVQELDLKAPAVPEATWHFLGHLQRNKAKRVVEQASWLHTLDSVRLADHLEALLARSERSLNVLLEVNLGGEASKDGLAPGDVQAVAEHVLRSCPRLRLCGLMTIPPPGPDPAPWFRALAGTASSLGQTLGHPLPELSMGMSDDLEVAIACGATMVRVGTALFGPRPAQ